MKSSIKKAPVAVLLLQVGCLALTIHAGASVTVPVVLENRFVSFEISRETGALRSIRDKELDSTYAFDGIGFEVATDSGIVPSEKVLDVKIIEGQAILRYAADGMKATLNYTLGPEDRIVEKWGEITPTGGKAYRLKSVVLEEMKTDAFSEIHFHDDQTIWHCPINLFLRAEKGGCFAGLQQPRVNVATALNTTVSGVYAHLSAIKDGETLKIPQFVL